MDIAKQPEVEARIQAMYLGVPEHIREDICGALLWAKLTLRERGETGHEFFVTAAAEPGLVVCSFAQPSWAGDHSGRGMDHGAEAIVMAVCEYLCGA